MAELGRRQVQLWLELDQYVAVSELANASRLSVAETVRSLLLEACRQHQQSGDPVRKAVYVWLARLRPAFTEARQQ